MLTIHRSNRVEALAAGLERVLREPLEDALQPEIIVVQSLGMRRWLSFEIARRFGVAMNCEFPFFANFAQRVFRGAGGQGFAREVLPWRVLGAMGTLWKDQALDPLRRYVSADGASELKRFELARQIATVFDRYMAFRPELLLRWEQGEDRGWQGLLWRTIVAQREEAHPPALLAALLEQVAGGGVQLERLPERVSVFGIASLPPFYLKLLQAVSRCLEVHFFLFEPTDQYWGDLQSPRAQRRFLRRHAKPGQTAADFHLEAGNELLASWGRAGQAFTREVQDLEPGEVEEAFVEPMGRTMLERVQRDVFRLRGSAAVSPSSSSSSSGVARGTPEDEEEEEEEDAAALIADGSLQIHCCHSPMRELEVLHDALLDLFQRHPDLTPKDVLVTMPDVQTHAPFIEAVFGAPEDERVRIPFTIADRSASARSAVARTFLKLLDLPGRRFTAAEVLALLEIGAVRERFGISEAELAQVRSGVERNSIRWGIDGRHRASFDLPPFEQNSWRAGLDRWLLGYALMGDSSRLCEGMLPDPEVEGSLAVLAGNFAEFAEELFEQVPALAASRTLREWSRALRRLLDTFFVEETADGQEVLAVRKALAALADLAEWHTDPVSFPAIRAHLQAVLGETDSGGGFLAGHVTFCSLRPMRSIPFRVICTLGMNDGAFPRREVPLAFDLLAEANGGEARSRREEDRQLFLESLLSARDVFYLSYCGRSAKDNADAPPSTIVSELLDYLEARVPRADGEPERRFVTKHRLQPFSPAYFDGESGLFSYSRENLLASQAGAAPRRAPGIGWVDAPLTDLDPEWNRVELATLIRFFKHPAKFFLRRLGVALPEAESPVDECEPLVLDALQTWNLANDLCQAHMAGRPMEAAVAAAEAAGRLPAGHFGKVELDAARRGVMRAGNRLKELDLGAPLPPRIIALPLGEWELTGTLEYLFERGRAEISGSTVSPKTRLSAWIQHLAMNAAGGDLPRRSVLIGADDECLHGPRDDAAKRLLQLLEIYRLGLRKPLPFFPRPSYTFAWRTLKPGNTRADPAATARKEFDGQESRDPHIAFCFPQGTEPCGAEWQDLALRIFSGIVEDVGNGWEAT
jgi:exodeoxyribonuclease V gamma subunit